MKIVEDANVGYSLPEGCNEFYVISGTLLHIQQFIYDTTAEGALKNLRGRSFYLILLTRAVCDMLLSRLQLSRRDVLYNSGGTFCVIAPLTKLTARDVEQVIADVSREIATSSYYNLLNVCGVKATRQELECECGPVFSRLYALKHRLKFALCRDMDYDAMQHVPQPLNKRLFLEIGTKLSDVTAILATRTDVSVRNMVKVDFPIFGSTFYLGKVSDFVSTTAPESYLLLINDTPAPVGCSLPLYRELVAGNGTRANSFEDLFLHEDSSHQRLAILRMDVDNLGAVLQAAMAEQQPLRAYSLFSRKLDCYFKEQLNEMWQRDYSDTTVIIYAGGDDLFIVGAWESTLSFMERINANFRRLFEEQGISLSGGVAFVKPKYPIIRAAEMGADEEALAKSFDYNGSQKNAISFFGTPMRWDKEYVWVRDYSARLYSLIQREEIDRSFVQHILSIAENVTYENRQVKPVRYVWFAAYDLSRMAKRQDGARASVGVRFIEQCITDIMSGRLLAGQPIDSPYHSLQLITLAARLTELKLWQEE